jgi:hypothetical protein
MGMYTEVFFRAEVSEEAARILHHIHDGTDFVAPNHVFFTLPRFTSVVRGTSFYFPGANHFVVDESQNEAGVCVSFRSNLKNYDGEIEAFFDWIDPHVVGFGGEFIGYSLYEESDTPTLFHKKGDQ